MRKRFEPQLELWQLLIEDTPTPRSRDGMADLAVALRELYKNKVYRDRILDMTGIQIDYGQALDGSSGDGVVAFICTGSDAFIQKFEL